MFRKVLDIDLTSKYSRFKPLDSEYLEHMVQKITKCQFFYNMTMKSSSFKGFHVELFCRIDCDICRMCYDDVKHFEYDMKRPSYARNILFDKKEKIKVSVIIG